MSTVELFGEGDIVYNVDTQVTTSVEGTMATTLGQYETELRATEAGPIGIRELKQNASAIIRRVREQGEAYTVTHRGKVVARLVPVEDPEEARLRAEEVWAEMDELTNQIGEWWPPDVSAVDAVKEQRREL